MHVGLRLNRDLTDLACGIVGVALDFAAVIDRDVGEVTAVLQVHQAARDPEVVAVNVAAAQHRRARPEVDIRRRHGGAALTYALCVAVVEPENGGAAPAEDRAGDVSALRCGNIRAVAEHRNVDETRAGIDHYGVADLGPVDRRAGVHRECGQTAFEDAAADGPGAGVELEYRTGLDRRAREQSAVHADVAARDHGRVFDHAAHAHDRAARVGAVGLEDDFVDVRAARHVEVALELAARDLDAVADVDRHRFVVDAQHHAVFDAQRLAVAEARNVERPLRDVGLGALEIDVRLKFESRPRGDLEVVRDAGAPDQHVAAGFDDRSARVGAFAAGARRVVDGQAAARVHGAAVEETAARDLELTARIDLGAGKDRALPDRERTARADLGRVRRDAVDERKIDQIGGAVLFFEHEAVDHALGDGQGGITAGREYLAVDVDERGVGHMGPGTAERDSGNVDVHHLGAVDPEVDAGGAVEEDRRHVAALVAVGAARKHAPAGKVQPAADQRIGEFDPAFQVARAPVLEVVPPAVLVRVGVDLDAAGVDVRALIDGDAGGAVEPAGAGERVGKDRTGFEHHPGDAERRVVHLAARMDGEPLNEGADVAADQSAAADFEVLDRVLVRGALAGVERTAGAHDHAVEGLAVCAQDQVLGVRIGRVGRSRRAVEEEQTARSRGQCVVAGSAGIGVRHFLLPFYI